MSAVIPASIVPRGPRSILLFVLLLASGLLVSWKWDSLSPHAGGMILALWGRDLLAEDCAVTDDAKGWGGMALAQNVGSPAEVDAVLAEAAGAGGTVPRPGGPTDWGGYNGVFADPDGHRWEVAHNPHWVLGADGSVRLHPV